MGSPSERRWVVMLASAGAAELQDTAPAPKREAYPRGTWAGGHKSNARKPARQANPVRTSASEPGQVRKAGKREGRAGGRAACRGGLEALIRWAPRLSRDRGRLHCGR